MDLEARIHSDHPEQLRLWLRLLTCTQLIESRVRANLREQFSTTLPRFDLMAQLDRVHEGMLMKDLSKRMMVTSGNVTGITDQLVAEGLVARNEVEGDRRAYRICLTARGRRAFAAMARAHERWIVEAFDLLTANERATLAKLLARLKTHQAALEASTV